MILHKLFIASKTDPDGQVHSPFNILFLGFKHVHVSDIFIELLGQVQTPFFIVAQTVQHTHIQPLATEDAGQTQTFETFVEYYGHKQAGYDKLKSGQAFYVEQTQIPFIKLEPVGQVHMLFKINAFFGHQQTLLYGYAPIIEQTHVLLMKVEPIGQLQLGVTSRTVFPEYVQE
ncbi:Hypothetical_protein [Hexamita inflata]|uniref:Hypothetical_protein n=1 Tax=Hexamita inflata TaxID=28002 RepID=A0AA86P739_9EUKA|nr:Hypothetical protein HINF_LOCUS20676 [Hexamita inflata]